MKNIWTLLFALFAAVLALIADDDLRHTLSAATERFADWFFFIFMVCALIATAFAVVIAYRKSANPNKKKNLRLILVTACILAAAYTVLMLIL